MLEGGAEAGWEQGVAVHSDNIQRRAQLPAFSFVVTQSDQNILVWNKILFEKKQYSQFTFELHFNSSLIN